MENSLIHFIFRNLVWGGVLVDDIMLRVGSLMGLLLCIWNYIVVA